MANNKSTAIVANSLNHRDFSEATLHHFLTLAVIAVLVALSLVSTKPSWAGNEHGHSHSAETHSMKAHVHGIAELEVAAFGKHRVVALFSPAANLLGFEHAASTPSQIDKVKAAEQLLKEKPLIALSPSTDCQLTSIDTGSLSAFLQPSAHQASEHQDIEIVWQYQCSSPTAPTNIDASALFAAFSGLEQLNVSVASEAGQTGGRLNPTSPLLTLPQ